MIGKEKLNKKGFTLVEVLAVIVILGILSTIGTVSIINLRKKQEEKFNNTQLQIFKQTSQTYFTDNKSKLPRPGTSPIKKANSTKNSNR